MWNSNRRSNNLFPALVPLETLLAMDISIYLMVEGGGGGNKISARQNKEGNDICKSDTSKSIEGKAVNERYRIERITRSGLKVARYIALEGRGAGDREWCYSKAIFLIDDFCNKKLYSWFQKYGQFQLNKNKRESKNSNSQLDTKFWIKSQIFNFPHLSWSEMFAQYFCCLQVCIRLNIICTFLWLLGSQQTKVLAISISIIVHGHPFLFRDGFGYFQYCKQNSQC